MINVWTALALATTLGGRVADGFGGPVAGAMVVAYDIRFAYEYTFTDDDGRWEIAGLPDRAWRVRVLPPMSVDRVETWYPGALAVCLAEPVPAGEHADLNLELSIGGRITGGLVSADGAELAGSVVIAESAGVGGVQEREAVADADGRFEILGVPSPALGPWRLRVQPRVGPPQYVGPDGAVWEPELASTFAPSSGVIESAGDVPVSAGATIGGAVNGPDGPVTTGVVRLFTGMSTLDAPIVDGRWTATGVAPGESTFWVVADGLATTFWPGVDRPGERFFLAEGEVRDDLDLAVPAEAPLVGRLVGPGDLSGVTVVVYNDDETIGVSETPASDGSFYVGGLHPGRYTASLFGAEEGFAAGRVGGLLAPRTFTAPDADVEIRLVTGAEISGRITEADSGAPIYGASVVAESLSGRRVGATTDADGAYRLLGLDMDAWAVHAEFAAPCPTDPDWVPVHQPGVIDPDLAGRLFLVPGDVARFDAALPRDDDHDGMGDAWEAAWGLDPTFADESLDPDGDGYINLREYRLGSDPQVAIPPPGCATGGAAGPLAGLLAALIARRRR